MNAPRNNFKTIIIALLVVLLAVNTVQLVQVKNELHHLRNDYISMYNTINNRVTNVQNTLTHQTNEIREILNEQESLFASASVDVSYQDRKLSVTISAVPKELKSSETLWASLSVNGETITQQFDTSGKAVIPLEPTVTSFVPTVQIKSPAGVKQQVLDEVSTIEFMSADVYVFWNDMETKNFEQGHILEFYLAPRKDVMPFTSEEIEDIYLIVSNTGPRGMTGTEPIPVKEAYSVAPIDSIYGTLDTVLPEGERVEVIMQEDSSDNKALMYYADLTAFFDRRDNIEYDVHLIVETVYGLTYSTAGYEPLADFCFDENSGHQSAGSPLLVPMFTENE
ncbi:MAG: hypothetical protein IJF50_01900 [Peptococcaceae bacterium]|nr:hypothetical protein [Peptococcaceae bacterium]